ncbi:MAG TPA: Asp-tRNA(Asn)/Glu-tRNA(Gln) amidotransferase subunit GatB [Candidatus Saccharimonadales bacterium]|jgi:aspartyl-tRNA(Asn)/glutamyl-tRNA(Gln) amidotransferase subunit B
MSDNPKYKLTVGIETHVQLKTKSKLFSGADNATLDAEPNTLVNHIDFGLPGALPVLNAKAIELASKAAFALNSRPRSFSKFDRKHYFYPDLPMGYQISQYDEPIILGGYVEFNLDGQTKRINLTRAHLEADAGKSVHPEGADYSLVDLNRAGTPLLEIVSEPEMHSADEAKAYAHELYLLIRYAGVSDANLYYGNMRFDVNVSVSLTDELGTRTETKNLNSFKAVERAIIFETARQIELLEKGEKIVQETRGWNDTKGKGYSMRSKENADDYRYMPDPDLPPVELSDKYIADIEASMPKLPKYWRESLDKFGLVSSITESLIEGEIEYGLANLEYIGTLEADLAKTVANWVVNIELPIRKKLSEQNAQVKLANQDVRKVYKAVYQLYIDSRLSSTNIKELLNKLLESENLPENIEDYAAQAGLMQESDEGKLGGIVDKVLADNSKAVEDIKAGEQKAVGFLVGQVMKASKGQANPGVVNELIKSRIKS